MRLRVMCAALALITAIAPLALAREQSDREKLDAKIEAAATTTRAPEMIIKPANEQQAWFLGWGIKQGLNASRFHGSTGSDMGGHVTYGFGFGAYAEIRMRDDIRFVPGLGYSERGGRGEFAFPVTGGTARFEMKSKLKYIEAPLLFEFGKQRNTWSPYFLAGASFSYKIDYQREVSDLGITPTPPAPIHFAEIFEEVGTIDSNTDFLEDFDWGPVLGLGGRFTSGRMNLVLEGRVYRGIPTLLGPEWGSDLQNGVFSLYAGVEFPSR